VCFTSQNPAVDWRWLEPNPARDVTIDAAADGRRATLRVRLEGDERSRGFARMRVEFGDTSATPWMGLVEQRDLVHTYAGTETSYTPAVWVQLRDGGVLIRRTNLRLEAPR
jgi:hypothetical protein